MTSCNNEGRTCKLLKSVMGITMSAAILATNLTCAVAQGNEYPYSSDFPNGIEDADISVFTESEIEYPLNMSFETNEEIEFVKANSQDEQISLSEDAYEGRFALDVKPANDEELLVKKTGDFTVGETMVSPAVYSLRTTSADGINVSVDDKQISVSGMADANKEVSIILFDENGSIAYVDQINSGAEGIFEFNFMVGEYGTYTMKLGNVTSSAIEQTIVVDSNTADDTITDTTIKVPATVDTKTNIVRLWIKPKYKAENISFYVTAVCAGTEKQLKILGDKDNDGVFKVPEDLALGKWQQITLDLLRLEEVPDSTVVKDFYISANEGSEWVIDSVESEYREINGNDVDLEQFAKENVVYEDGKLKFKSESHITYNKTTQISTGIMNINEKISNITVDASMFKPVANPVFVEESKSLLAEPISKSLYEGVEIGYDESISIPCNITTDELTKIHLEFASHESDKIVISTPTGYSTEQYLSDSNADIIVPPITQTGNITITSKTSSIELTNIDIQNIVYNDTHSKYIYDYPNGSYIHFNGESSYKASEYFSGNDDLKYVSNPSLKGEIVTSIPGYTKFNYMVLKFINLNIDNNGLNYIKCDYNDRYYTIPYGETELVVYNKYKSMFIPIDSNILLISYYGIDTEDEMTDFLDSDRTSTYTIPGYSDGVWSGDYMKYYYNNTLDNNHIYCFNTADMSCKKVLDTSSEVVSSTYTGNKLKTNNAIYDLETGEIILDNGILTPNGDIFSIEFKDEVFSVYKYSKGNKVLLFEVDEFLSSSSSWNIIFNPHHNYFIFDNRRTARLFKYDEDTCTYICDVICGSERVILSNDASTIYYYNSNNSSTIAYDIASKSTIRYEQTKFWQQASDDRFLISKYNTDSNKDYYYLFDSNTCEEEYIDFTDKVVEQMKYCSERNQILYVGDGELNIIDLNMNTEHNKYLLSFDGKKTWYAYDGGRWVVASVSAEPTLAEMKKSGMTKEEINAIPEEAYAKLYENGNEIYTLNFAIGMFGTTEYITPVVKSITVNTIANQPVDSIYSSKLFTFNKAEYNKVSGVFPVEDFPKVSECYYLLYLGNDWVYTYKDGAVKKLDTSVDKLMEDVNSSWIDIKQAGLNASELRSIPESVLTELFVNEKFANEKFGVIAVSKIKDDSTMDYSVEIKLSAETKYIAEDGYVLEISLNGAEKVVYTPADITKAQIDDFLAWLDERQNGGGNIFYRMQTENNQNFINYYNITNVNVYKESDTTEE